MKMKNPLALWLETQPLNVTQTSLARDLGVSRAWISFLMHEAQADKGMPSLRLALAIEKRTGIKAETLLEYYEDKKRRMAA